MKSSSVLRTIGLAVALIGFGLSLAAAPAVALSEQTSTTASYAFPASADSFPQTPVAAETPGPATGPDGKPVARFLLFYSTTCPHCEDLMANYLPTVYEKYGNRVEHQDLEINQGDNYLKMLGLETKLGVPQSEQGRVPALVIADQVLIGGADIPARLEGLIDGYLAQGGVDYQSLEDLPTVVPPTPALVVQAVLFYHPDDPGLEDLQAFFSVLGQKYGSQLALIPADRTDPQSAALLEQLVAALGGRRPSATEPVLLIDRQLLLGSETIRSQIPGLVDRYLTEGGRPLPPLSELIGGATPVPATPTVPAGEAAPIYLAYFEKAGCQECARTTNDLNQVKRQFPQLVVETFPIEEAQALNEWLCDRYNVPETKRLTTPMVFVGDDVLIGTEATLANLTAAVGRYAGPGAPRTWEAFNPEQGESGIVERFRGLGVLAVMGAGLIDGLNPCAFATLVFFISYLAFTGRRGRDILFVGVAFALGVFLTYLLVGIGLLKAVQALPFFTSLGRWIYLVTALLCIVLAALTFRDFFKARHGQAGEMALKLPMRLRKQINRVIREGAQMRAFVAVALVTGFVVSLIELACTGQVYLPTIVFVLSVPELATRALLYLVLYCVMFIVPLVVVFFVSYLGTTSEQLSRLIGRHTATVKALTGALFVVLALWMTWTVAPLFGAGGGWAWLLMLAVAAAIAGAVVVVRPWRKPARGKRPVPRHKRSRA